MVGQKSEYTFKYNSNLGRHGWLRLTPAYSVKLMEKVFRVIPPESKILDPFSGTATTGLVAAERSIEAHCLEINPFLVWFSKIKCTHFSSDTLSEIEEKFESIMKSFPSFIDKNNWLPPIHNIDRWWSKRTQSLLSALRESIRSTVGEPRNSNECSLIWVAFCRLIIETSSAAFNHVSMSFGDKSITYEQNEILELFEDIFNMILASASKGLKTSPTIHCHDSKSPISLSGFTHVVTSPPYPNRISYIRELRPYMYWTRFLDQAREAGELDWRTIGGTWGIATSNLMNWESQLTDLPESILEPVKLIEKLDVKNSKLMSQYVLKYFCDMFTHIKSISSSLSEGARLYYIVGNSSFYGIQVRTQDILQEVFECCGFQGVDTHIVRKRNSKKELFEFCVMAQWRPTKIQQKAKNATRLLFSDQFRISF